MFPINGQVKTQQLQSRPSEAELNELAHVAKTDQRMQFAYVWARESPPQKYMIAVRQWPIDPTMFQWTMYLDAEPEAQGLWEQNSADLTQIHAMIVNSTSAAVMSVQRKEDASSWDEQCRTFEGADGLPIIEIDRLHDIQMDIQESALKGELSLVGIANVLNSISMSNLSGRLSIDARDKRADIFFLDGAPVSATSTMGDGMECMLRLAALDEGKYFFDPRVRTNEIERTIFESIPSIMLQGAKLADNTNYLTEMGLISDSVLIKADPNMTEAQFESLLTDGEPLDLSVLKATYLAADGETNLKSLVRKLGLSRTQWVPLLANLIRCGALTLQKTASHNKLKVTHKSIPADVRACLGKEFTEASGLYSYPAFLYILERECYRADSDRPLTLIVFEIVSPGGNLDDLKWALNRIFAMMIGWKRRIDVLAHYESGQYAMMMPDTKAAKAAENVCNLMKELLANSAISKIANQLQMCFGIASLPDDAEDMMVLLAAAEKAKLYSQTSHMPVILSCDVDSHQESMSQMVHY